jgi:hypothetical protein
LNPFRRNSKFRARPNQSFFQAADEFHRAQAFPILIRRRKCPQIKYRVRYQLPRPVKGYVPTAIAFMHLNAATGKRFSGSNNIPGVSVAAQRDHWRVFEQEKCVPDPGVFTKCD